MWWGALTLALVVGPPCVLPSAALRAGRADDRQVVRRSQRPALLGAAAVTVTGAVLLLVLLGAPRQLVAPVLAMLLGLGAKVLTTLVCRASMHLAVAAGACATAVGAARHDGHVVGSRTHGWVVRRRLATQRVTGPPLPASADAVRLLTAVQAQDAPLAAFSLGLRSRTSTYAGVLAERATGTVVRTHVLRPTWHLLAAEDLRWLLRLTSPKVERSMGARHHQLGLDEPLMSRAVEAVAAVVQGFPTAPSRREVQRELDRMGVPAGNEQVAHVLLVAELRGVICSAATTGTEHRYALVDDVVPPSPLDDLDREAALDLLVLRFFGGHGPASPADLRRWSGVTLAESGAALARVGGRLERLDLDGEELWFDPTVPFRTSREEPAHLLPTFDEAVLSYAITGFHRADPTVERRGRLGEAGGGVLVAGARDVGTWKRTVTSRSVTVLLRPEVDLGSEERTALESAAERLAAFVERPLDLQWA